MEPKDLHNLLEILPPLAGEPPAWARDLEPEDLVLAARWIRTRLDTVEARAAAKVLSTRLRTVRSREGQDSMLGQLFDAALEILGSSNSGEEIGRWAQLVDVAESTVGRMPQVQAWLDVLKAIVGDGKSRAEPNSGRSKAKDFVQNLTAIVGDSTSTTVPIFGPDEVEDAVQDPTAIVRDGRSRVEPNSGPDKVEDAAQDPTTPIHMTKRTLEKHCRSMRMTALSRVAEFDEANDARWGIDFGTAWSKTTLRSTTGVVEEHAKTTECFPSIVAVERGGDTILFGDEASNVSLAAPTWNVSTSMKRFLVGKHINTAGMPIEMTTERLATLYVAWLLHRAQTVSGNDLSPSRLVTHLSLPLAGIGDPPQLRDFFTVGGAIVAPRRHYRDWLQKAFRMAQLIAVTYQGEPWPTSVSELVTLLQVWDQDDWNKVQRKAAVLSEPAAVVGDFEPMSLAEGLTLLVDCGAGTTDASIFWRREGRVFRVVEYSAVVGGDTIDAAIEAVVLLRNPEFDPYKSNIIKWARDVKPNLLVHGTTDFDPDVVLNLRGGLSSMVSTADIQPSLNDLGQGVQNVVSTVINSAERALLDARPSGQNSWPTIKDLRDVWFSGGTSAVKQVPEGINAALRNAGIPIESKLLVPPAAYATWNPERYRTMSCAAGASRRDLLRPEDLQPERVIRTDSLSHWDK